MDEQGDRNDASTGASPVEGAPATEEPLGTTVRRGLLWSFLNNGLGRVGTLVSGIVLARLLSPDDYGVFALALVAMMVLMSLNDMGLTAVIVRWPGDVDRIGPTATTLIFAMSCLLYAAFFVVAPPFARAMGSPTATPLLRVMALALVVDGAFAVPTGMLTRSIQQGRRAAADLTGFVIGTTLAIVLAAHGFGAWSLVWGRLLTNLVVASLVFVLAPARYRPGWDLAVAREILHEGLPLTGSTFLQIALLNVDYLVVGRVLGSTELGLYLLAFNLSSWPINMFATAIRRVSLAGFARLQHDLDALRSGVNRAISLALAASVPVCVLLAVLAAPLIRFVYGAKWEPGAEALRWLALLGIARVFLELSWDVLVAIGRSRAVMWLNGLWLAALVPALTVGAHLGGIRGVGIGHVLVAAGLVVPAYLWSLAAAGVSPGDVGRHLGRPLVGGALVALAGWFAARTVHGDFVELAVGGTVALGLYVVVVLPMRHLARAAPPAPTPA